MPHQPDPHAAEPIADGIEHAPDGAAASVDVGGGAVAFVPSDNTTLTSVLAGLAGDGYVAQFAAAPAGALVCGACGNSRPAAEFDVADIRRLEGASDPDEMVSVVLARCPACRSQGTAVLGFGPNGSGVDADVAVALPRPGAPG